MKKSILLLTVLAIAFSFAISQSFALTQAKAPDSGAPAVTPAGNEYCPVSGDKVTDQGGVVEYEGKSYKLCCPMCAKEFLKDPEKYIAKMKAQEESGEVPEGGMMGMEGHEGHES